MGKKMQLMSGGGLRAPPLTALVLLAAAVVCMLSSPGWAITYGIKSTAGPDEQNPSHSPAHLYKFDEVPGSLTDIGTIRIGGTEIDADGLAGAPQYGLLGFRIESTGSTLVSINSSTAAATVLGSLLSGRAVRGATFDSSGVLWALDSANNKLLTIDPANGGVLSEVGLKLGGITFDLMSGTDIAFRPDTSTFYMTNLANIYTITTGGAMTYLYTDAGQQLVGAAFSPAAPGNDLFGLEVNGTDDVFVYDVNAGFARTSLYTIGGFNAGRGDLATMTPQEQQQPPVPEPVTLAGLALGISGLATYLRRRRAA